MLTAVLFVLMMLVLVIPHEFGHFIVAKLCDVKVNEFSVGMGPLIFKKQKGETQYSVRLLPLGGFCAMEGEDEESDNPRAFNNKSAWQKTAILLAGVTMNVIIAILVLTISYEITGVPTNTLSEVNKGYPAQIAGIEAGDKVIEIDGVATRSWTDVTEQIGKYQEGDKLEIVVKRDGAIKTYELTPQYDEERESYLIGIVAGSTRNPLACVKYGAVSTWNLNLIMIEGIKSLFDNGIHAGDVSGPVGIVKIVDETKDYGFSSYLMLLALVSLNLALINILPFPALDGGRILFVIIRAITGNAISDELEGKFHAAGLIILLMLFVLVTIGDIKSLF